jgi:hypothetical protein
MFTFPFKRMKANNRFREGSRDAVLWIRIRKFWPDPNPKVLAGFEAESLRIQIRKKVRIQMRYSYTGKILIPNS